MLAALVIGVVSAQDAATCAEKKTTICCGAFADLSAEGGVFENPSVKAVKKAFGPDIQMPKGSLGALCSLPDKDTGKCSNFLQTTKQCYYFTSQYTGIAAGCS